MKQKVPGVSTKRVEATQPPTMETEALRTGQGRREMTSLTWQMAFPVEKSPTHSISSYTEKFLLSLCPYTRLQNWFSMRPTLASWRWKGVGRGAVRIRRKSEKFARA